MALPRLTPSTVGDFKLSDYRIGMTRDPNSGSSDSDDSVSYGTVHSGFTTGDATLDEEIRSSQRKSLSEEIGEFGNTLLGRRSGSALQEGLDIGQKAQRDSSRGVLNLLRRGIGRDKLSETEFDSRFTTLGDNLERGTTAPFTAVESVTEDTRAEGFGEAVDYVGSGATNIFFNDVANSFFRAGMGRDLQTGEVDVDPDAWDAVEIGATAVGAGAGSKLLRGLRGADNARFSNLFRSGGATADDLPAVVDDVAETAGRTADDVADASTRTFDDVVGAGSRSADDVAETAGRTADETSSSIMRALSPSRTTTGFLGAGAGVVGAFTLFGTPEGESGGSGEQGGVPNGDDPSEATPAGEAQPDKELDFGWELWRQPLSDGGNDWFVWREENGMECINKQGAAQSFSGYVNDAVFFGSRDAAMTAYNTWVKNNGDDGGEKSWDTARQFDEVAGWALFEQAHLTDDKTRYFALSTIESGETVSLLPDGSYRVVPAEEVDGEVRYDTSKVHFYTSRSALVSALEAYMANQSQPNPSQPPVVGGGAAGGVIEGTEGEDGGLVGGLASSPVGIVALLVVLGAGYYIYKTKVK